MPRATSQAPPTPPLLTAPTTVSLSSTAAAFPTTLTAIGNVIFLNHDLDSFEESKQISSLNHEYGHIKQYKESGLGKYLIFIGLPSITYNLISSDDKTLENNYLNMPWEYDADVRAKVTRDDTAVWASTIRDLYFGLIDFLIP